MKLKLLSHSANDLFWFILPLVLPFLLERYSLSYTQAGGILTVYLAVTAVFSVIMGKLSDRFSPRIILSGGLVLAGLGLGASGFAPSLAVFLLLVSITAVGVSTFHPVMYAIIDRSYPENKGSVMGVYESFGTGAILIMFLVNGFLFKFIGLRGVMIITAAPALIMGMAIALTRDPSYAPIPHAAGKETQAKADPKAVRRFVLFLVSIILRVLSVTAIINFMPTIFVRFFGFAESAAAYGTGLFFAGGIAGSLLGGKVSERFNPFGILMVASLFITFTILGFNLPLPKPVYPLFVAALGLFGSGCIINQNLLMARLGGSLGKGEIFGILMGAMTMTSSIAPTILGFVIDQAGFRAAFYLFSIPIAASMAILFYLRKTETP